MSWGTENFLLDKPGGFSIASARGKRRLSSHSPRVKNAVNAGANMPERTQGIRTIVVDDSPTALRAICSVIAQQQELRFVGAASNGREGVALARTVHPDLVLLDLEMPVMNGIEATSCLGRDCPEACVIVVTVHDKPGLRKLCYERGARGFIRKDSLKDELPVVVRQLFSNGG